MVCCPWSSLTFSFSVLTRIVAMTRPRRHLCICGDSETVSRWVCIKSKLTILATMCLYLCSGSPFLKRWMAFLEENADLRYPDISEFTS